MRFLVSVKPDAKAEKVTGEGARLTVLVKAPPREGKANEAVISALAAHFKVAKSQINIVSGHTARKKVVEIPVANLL